MSDGGETRLTGTVAAPGLARGVLFPLRESRPVYHSRGPEADRAALAAAIEQAAAALTELMSATESDEAAGMLAFQVAMLEDEVLTGPAYAAIEGGQPADRAWADAFEDLIEDFAGSDDPAFAARSADLVDLRDRVLDALCGRGGGLERVPERAILVADDLTPSRFLEVDWNRAAGIALASGSRASHVAILARGRGVPMLVGLGGGAVAAPEGASAWLDAEGGLLVVNPTPATEARYAARDEARAASRLVVERFRVRPARTASGAPVTVYVNLDDPDRFPDLDPAWCDGVGLARSEFLFERPDGRLPDEDQQYEAYARLVRWAQGRPVTIRTLDAGGDKPIPGLTGEHERNPFLGLRGLRLSLARPEVFAVQVRALLRTAALGEVKVMLPMVTTPAEVERARAIFAEELAALERAGTRAAMPALGMMVEVPAAAIAVDRFDVDFYSIGTNDLIQYVCAAGRDNDAVAALYDPTHPAVLHCLRLVAAHGAATGREVSLCGDMASDPAHVATLLDCGITALSVTPAAIGAVKQAVAAVG